MEAYRFCEADCFSIAEYVVVIEGCTGSVIKEFSSSGFLEECHLTQSPDARINLKFFDDRANNFHFFSSLRPRRLQILTEASCNDELFSKRELLFSNQSSYCFERDTRTLRVLSPATDKPFLKLQVPLIFLLANLGPSTDGIFLHGAGAVIEGNAFAILGIPEAGKSTSIAMIEHDFLLSDDMLVMRFQNDVPMLHSTPLGPNTDGSGSAPLKAIFYPVKSDHFELKPLSRLKAIEQYYHAQAGYWDKVFKPYRKMHFEKVCQLFAQVKAYELHFSKDYIDNNAIQQALRN